MKRWYNIFLISKFFSTISATISYLKVKRKISYFFYGEGFRVLIKQYLNGELREDWLGRLYCVVNPSIDKKGDFNISSSIIEIDGENTNNKAYVENWFFKQMRLIGSLFKINNLYDYINYTIEHVGPENHDNFLLIFDIVERQRMSDNFKSFIKQFLIYAIIIGAGALVYLKYIL